MADHCQGCGAPIVWAVTVNGKRMPLEEDRHAGNLELTEVGRDTVARVVTRGYGTHLSHFATCPEATRFRRSRR